MQITIIDRLALYLPALGGLVPATMTYHNSLTVLGFPIWQAALLGLVVEVIGFVAIATTLDLWEMYQDGLQARMESWDAPKSRLGGQFWVALAGTLVYLFVVVAINALLDEGGALEKTTKGLMASFGLLGGLMLALRNQMTKERAARAQARTQAAQVEAEARERQLHIEAEEREFARKLKEERLRQNHEIKLQKLAQKVEETLPKVSEPAEKLPETFGKWHDWRKLPESERRVVAALESWEKVAELYGTPEKTSANWLKNAQREYGGEG
jgi:hypothetical protein